MEVNLKDHINVPVFQTTTGDQFYDQQFNDYLTKISLSQLPQSRPLWEIHVIKYPTRAAAGHVVFKLHHALGDGFSIMGALLSCLQRADDPSLPLTFPLLRNDLSLNAEGGKGIWNAFSGFFNTVSDFGWSLMKSSFAEDDRTLIRSGDDGVEFRPIDIFTITFCLDQIKLIKSNLQVVRLMIITCTSIIMIFISFLGNEIKSLGVIENDSWVCGVITLLSIISNKCMCLAICVSVSVIDWA